MTWIDANKEKPPLNEFVECIFKRGKKDYPWWNSLGRDLFAWIKNGPSFEWHGPNSSELDWGNEGCFNITHWKYIDPDPKGYKPYYKMKKFKNGTYEPKVIFRKAVRIEINTKD